MSGSKPEISVVIPLYNKEPYVERAIRSVLAQTFQDFEVIIVNDGSTDDGPGVVRRLSKSTGDRHIRIIDQENAGVSAARNRGIDETRAELVAFLDADDEWTPWFLETVARLRRRHPHCDVFATRYRFKVCERGETRERHPVIRGIPAAPWEGVLTDYFGVAARSDPPVWSSAVAATKSALREIGGFPVGVTLGEDLLVWARLAARYGVAYSSWSRVFCWIDTSARDEHRRAPCVPDTVGQGLAQLAEEPDRGDTEARRRYVALWHRMRSNVFLTLGCGGEARNEIRKALDAGGPRVRLLVLLLFTLMPRSISLPLLMAGRTLLRKSTKLA